MAARYGSTRSTAKQASRRSGRSSRRTEALVRAYIASLAPTFCQTRRSSAPAAMRPGLRGDGRGRARATPKDTLGGDFGGIRRRVFGTDEKRRLRICGGRRSCGSDGRKRVGRGACPQRWLTRYLFRGPTADLSAGENRPSIRPTRLACVAGGDFRRTLQGQKLKLSGPDS